MREIVRYAGTLAVVDAAIALFDQIDALLIGAILGASSVGLFQAPLRITTLLIYPGYAIANGVAPRLARGLRESPNAKALLVAFRVIVLFQAALLAPMIVWAGPIIDLLFGHDFAESANVLRGLAVFVFLSGVAPLVSLGANYLGLARRRVPIAVAAVLINIVVDLILIPRIGIVGAAIGTSLAFALYVPAHLWLCWRSLDLSLRAIVLPLLRSLSAAMVMCVILLAVGTESLSVAQWLGGASAGLAAYVATLIATRELSRSDLAEARRLVRRRGVVS